MFFLVPLFLQLVGLVVVGAVGRVGNPSGLSKGLWSTRQGCPRRGGQTVGELARPRAVQAAVRPVTIHSPGGAYY